MNGTVVLITGATSGLGRQLAQRLAAEGAEVGLHGRDRPRVEDAARQIAAATGSDRLRSHVADLASLAETRRLADEVTDRYDRLDVLVNNAGVGGGPNERRASARRELSRDGHELRFAVNYLAHVALTRQLLALIRRSAPARIINVASAGQEPIDFDDVMFQRGYEPFRAYQRSKLAQIMFTFELAEQLRGTGVTVNALHPATLMDTKMVTESFGYSLTTVGEGVAATHRLVADPALDGVTGQYFDGQREASADRQAYEPAARARLREISEELIAAR